MTTRPRSRSMLLAFPQVWMTNPSLTKSRFASQTCCFNSSSMGIGRLFPNPVADVNQLLHHAKQIAAPVLRAEGVVQRPVKRIQFAVDFMRLGVGLVNFRFQAGHLLLCCGVILVRAGDDR